MKVGYSLENEVLEDFYSSAYSAEFHNLEELLFFLKSKNVKVIEIRKLVRSNDSQPFQEKIKLIWEMGFELSVHGDIAGNFSGNSFIDIYPSLEFIISNLEKYQKNLIIPIHAYQANSDNGNVKKLNQDTIEVLGNWAYIIETEKLPIYLALENNRNKKTIVDPGNSTESVINMVNEINHPHVGICWDMGHYYSNLIQKTDTKSRPTDLIRVLPSNSFLEKVFHTHIHGINILGRTHFPLTDFNSLPLENYCETLQEGGYDGIYNLELSISRWSKEKKLKTEIISTINRLNNLSPS